MKTSNIKSLIMKRILAILILISGWYQPAKAQLIDGSTAPDFVMTDLDGVQHHLYTYLSSGKTVFLEFFACHCPSCWAYHNSGKLESLNQMYGPDGTDQIVVLMVEHDPNNGEDHFLGNHWYTQGDWVTGTTIPKINAEGVDRWIFSAYEMNYYPMVYKICPDLKTELMSTSMTVADLFQAADDCPGTLSIDEEQELVEINIKDYAEKVSELQIVNSAGQQLYFSTELNSEGIDLSSFEAGVYFISIVHSAGTLTKKVYLQ